MTTNAAPLTGKVAILTGAATIFGIGVAKELVDQGARIYLVDIDRAGALAEADIVITGVPTPSFTPIDPAELKEGAVCLNFSSVNNFAEGIEDKASIYISRVGPVTVAMCMRNTLRLFKNFHQK